MASTNAGDVESLVVGREPQLPARKSGHKYILLVDDPAKQID
jgi:hypothetical protein